MYGMPTMHKLVFIESCFCSSFFPLDDTLGDAVDVRFGIIDELDADSSVEYRFRMLLFTLWSRLSSELRPLFFCCPTADSISNRSNVSLTLKDVEKSD